MAFSRRTLLSAITRYGICGAAVYYTAKYGIWGSQQEAENIYLRASKVSKQYLSELDKTKYGHKVIVKLNTSREQEPLGRSAEVYWNTGVQKTFSSLNNLSKSMRSYAKMGTEKLENYWKEEKATGQKKL